MAKNEDQTATPEPEVTPTIVNIAANASGSAGKAIKKLAAEPRPGLPTPPATVAVVHPSGKDIQIPVVALPSNKLVYRLDGIVVQTNVLTVDIEVLGPDEDAKRTKWYAHAIFKGPSFPHFDLGGLADDPKAAMQAAWDEAPRLQKLQQDAFALFAALQ